MPDLKKKKTVKRPSPGMLGTGLAGRAGKALEQRRKGIDKMLEEMDETPTSRRKS